MPLARLEGTLSAPASDVQVAWRAHSQLVSEKLSASGCSFFDAGCLQRYMDASAGDSLSSSLGALGGLLPGLPAQNETAASLQAGAYGGRFVIAASTDATALQVLHAVPLPKSVPGADGAGFATSLATTLTMLGTVVPRTLRFTGNGQVRFC